MILKSSRTTRAKKQVWERIPMASIRRFAKQVAKQFDPEKIVLFGSYAWGKPDADSDVDILVVMPARNQHDQAVQIRWAIPVPFPMDLLVRTPKNLAWRLKEGESFHTQIMTQGKVLHEKSNSGVGAESRSRPSPRRVNRSRKRVIS